MSGDSVSNATKDDTQPIIDPQNVEDSNSGSDNNGDQVNSEHHSSDSDSSSNSSSDSDDSDDSSGSSTNSQSPTTATTAPVMVNIAEGLQSEAESVEGNVMDAYSTDTDQPLTQADVNESFQSASANLPSAVNFDDLNLSSVSEMETAANPKINMAPEPAVETTYNSPAASSGQIQPSAPVASVIHTPAPVIQPPGDFSTPMAGTPQALNIEVVAAALASVNRKLHKSGTQPARPVLPLTGTPSSTKRSSKRAAAAAVNATQTETNPPPSKVTKTGKVASTVTKKDKLRPSDQVKGSKQAKGKEDHPAAPSSETMTHADRRSVKKSRKTKSKKDRKHPKSSSSSSSSDSSRSESSSSSDNAPGTSARIGKISEGYKYQKLAMSRAKKLGVIKTIEGQTTEITGALNSIQTVKIKLLPTHAYKNFYKINGVGFPHVRHCYRELMDRYSGLLGSNAKLQLLASKNQLQSKRRMIGPELNNQFSDLWRFNNELDRAVPESNLLYPAATESTQSLMAITDPFNDYVDDQASTSTSKKAKVKKRKRSGSRKHSKSRKRNGSRKHRKRTKEPKSSHAKSTKGSNKKSKKSKRKSRKSE